MGDDPAQIGAHQYDFLTLATHELAHTVGLGESSDPGSVLYGSLKPGMVRRAFTASDLARINTVADPFAKVGAAGSAPGTVAPPVRHEQPGPGSGRSPEGDYSLAWARPVAAASTTGLPGADRFLVGGPDYALALGSDLLLGGRGADRLGGDGHDDLFIAAPTAFDTNDVALGALPHKGNRGGSYAARIAKLKGGTGQAGVVRPLGNGIDQTVFNDAAADTLTGGSGSD